MECKGELPTKSVQNMADLANEWGFGRQGELQAHGIKGMAALFTWGKAE
jgi:hypothetical protein